MTNRPRTAQIKPSTREAVLDQLAAIADGIIRDRENEWAQADEIGQLRARLERSSRSMTAAAVRIHVLESRRPWHLAWWRK